MKIGVFDSGHGGRFALKKLEKILPQHEFIGFFDHANAPYGELPPEQITQLTRSGCQHLYQQQGCNLILLACNTASASSLRRIQESNPPFKVLGCLIPAIEQAIEQGGKQIGIIATKHTVNTKKYQREAFKVNPFVKAFSVATPKLVPWIEDESHESDECKNYLRAHVQLLIDEHNIGTLILGCTHYSALKAIVESMFPQLKVIDSAQAQAEKLVDYLADHPELE